MKRLLILTLLFAGFLPAQVLLQVTSNPGEDWAASATVPAGQYWEVLHADVRHTSSLERFSYLQVWDISKQGGVNVTDWKLLSGQGARTAGRSFIVPAGCQVRAAAFDVDLVDADARVYLRMIYVVRQGSP